MDIIPLPPPKPELLDRHSNISGSSTSTNSVPSIDQSVPLKMAELPNTTTTSSSLVSKNPSHPLPAFARDYPKPTTEVDVDEALGRKPARWSFRGALEANSKKQPRTRVVDETKQAEAHSADYAAAKKFLLETAEAMNTAKPR